MKKQILIICTAVVFTILCRVFIRDTQTTCLIDFTYDEYGRILVPMQINGANEWGLWDTGASVSFFPKRADQQPMDSVSIYVGRNNRWEMMAIFQVDRLTIGDFELTDCTVVEHDENTVGGDVINRHYWLFDFNTQQCRLSTHPIEVQNEIELVLPFEYAAARPICKLAINNAYPLTMLFDTGHSGGMVYPTDSTGASVAGVELGFDFWVHQTNPAIKAIETGVAGVTPFRSGADINGWILNGVKVNNTYTTLAVRAQSNPQANQIDGVITNNFVRRFDQMYYDPYARRVHLYASTQRAASLLGADVYRYLDYALKEAYPYKVTPALFDAALNTKKKFVI